MKKVIKGDIYYADLNPTKGDELGGIKPVLILQNNISNIDSKTTIVAPITTLKDNELKEYTHIAIRQFDKIRANSVVMLEQVRVIDKNRLKGYVGLLEEEQMNEVNKMLRLTFDI